MRHYRAHRSVVAAAQELNCSQGYIFAALKANGLKLKDIVKGQVETEGVSHEEDITVRE